MGVDSSFPRCEKVGPAVTRINKPVTRLTTVEVRDPRLRPLVVTLEAECLALRQARCRKVYRLPYAVAFTRAARLEAEQKRYEKIQARKRKGK